MSSIVAAVASVFGFFQTIAQWWRDKGIKDSGKKEEQGELTQVVGEIADEQASNNLAGGGGARGVLERLRKRVGNDSPVVAKASVPNSNATREAPRNTG